jgi:lysophospholipase L1-like esterase
MTLVGLLLLGCANESAGGANGADAAAGMPGTAGVTGMAGTTGTAGTQGIAGAQGSAGSGGASTGGAAAGGAGGGGGPAGAGGEGGGLAGSSGAGGRGGIGGAGQAGAGGRGGGAAGMGGTAGGAGRGGASGAGQAGTGGRGGGAAGMGGTAGGAGRGGASGGAGGSGGGAGAYNPCPTNGDPCKVLPLGDSITHGYASSDDGGYRSQLFKLIVAANQKVTFTGSLTNGPTQVSGQTFPRSHEGHDGWTIDPGYSTYGLSGISTLIPSPALNGGPHIILLHIGTNDAGFMDAANMSTRLEALLDKIAQAAPSALIVLAQTTPLGYTSAPLTTYDAKIPGIVQSHAAKGQHIVGVDMSKMPVPADIGSDNVHPNDQGYAYMANIWYAALKDLLPK